MQKALGIHGSKGALMCSYTQVNFGKHDTMCLTI